MNTLLDPFEIASRTASLAPVPLVPAEEIEVRFEDEPPAQQSPSALRDSWTRLRCWCSED